jgi:hypothetical protein
MIQYQPLIIEYHVTTNQGFQESKGQIFVGKRPRVPQSLNPSGADEYEETHGESLETRRTGL